MAADEARHFAVRRAAAALAAAGAAGFALTVLGYQGHWDADQAVHDWALGIRTPGATAVLAVVTILMGPPWMAVITLTIAVVWALGSREWRRPVLLLGSVGAAMLLSTLLKALFGRARPDPAGMLLGAERSPAFPSGHTIDAAVLALALTWLLVAHHGRRGATTPARRAAVGKPGFAGLTLAALFAAVVGFSRIYLGYHWLTDVLASLGLALVVLAGVMLADLRLSRR